MTWSAPIGKGHQAKIPIESSPSSNICFDPKIFVLESSNVLKLTPMPSKQIRNFDLNFPRVKLQNSTAGHSLTMSDTSTVGRIKREAHPVLRQDPCLELKGQASLVLTGCQQCLLYVMTPVGNDKCPSCLMRNLKEFRKLEREAAERDDDAKRIKLVLCL